jgi:hypothetical protein
MDEFLHLIKQAAAQQTGDYRPFVYGHIASYDPKLHRIKAIVPSLRDENDQPVLTPWMPLGSLMVGSGFGVQFAPVGGATYEKPTDGEQVTIHIIDQDQGVSLSAHLAFNQVMAPPFTDLKPGEAAIKVKSGSYLKMTANGDIEANTQGKTLINAKGDVDIATDGSAVVAAKGAVTITGSSVTIQGETIQAVPPSGGAGV